MVQSRILQSQKQKVWKNLLKQENCLSKKYIIMLENRHEEIRKNLRNEIMQTNKRLQKSVEELSNKLDEERRRNFDASQHLRNDFIEKETKLTLEINTLKDQLLTERSVRNQEVEHLNAMVSESMAGKKDGFQDKRGS